MVNNMLWRDDDEKYSILADIDDDNCLDLTCSEPVEEAFENEMKKLREEMRKLIEDGDDLDLMDMLSFDSDYDEVSNG